MLVGKHTVAHTEIGGRKCDFPKVMFEAFVHELAEYTGESIVGGWTRDFRS